MSIEKALQIVADKFIAVGAPESVRWDLASSYQSVKSCYCKYRRLSSGEGDDYPATLHVGDVTEQDGRLSCAIYASSLGDRVRKIAILHVDN